MFFTLLLARERGRSRNHACEPECLRVLLGVIIVIACFLAVCEHGRIDAVCFELMLLRRM